MLRRIAVDELQQVGGRQDGRVSTVPAHPIDTRKYDTLVVCCRGRATRGSRDVLPETFFKGNVIETRITVASGHRALVALHLSLIKPYENLDRELPE